MSCRHHILLAIFICSAALLESTFGCLPGLGGGSDAGACCPPGPSCHQANQCSGSYVSPPIVGPASYAVPPPSYAQPPPQYAQPIPPIPLALKYPNATGK